MSVEEKAATLDMKGVMVSLIVSAFGFVAALFWKDAIQAMIESIVPEGEGVLYQFGAAVLVTIIAVVAIYIVSKHFTKINVPKRG
jgi:hypothetical protein